MTRPPADAALDDSQMALQLGPQPHPPDPAALAGQEAATRRVDPAWVAAVDTAIERLAATGQPFSAGDVRELVSDAPGGDHGNAWGPRFSRAHRNGVIRPTRALASRRRSRHGGLTREWVGAWVGGDAA